jgi:hypothetical protein
MMEQQTMLDLCALLSEAADTLKYLTSSGNLTEEDRTAFADLKGACEDFITAFDYYIV